MKFTLDILELLKKSKKKVLNVFICNLETYTRYSGVADEELKKVLGVFNGSFLSKLVGGIAFLISFK